MSQVKILLWLIVITLFVLFAIDFRIALALLVGFGLGALWCAMEFVNRYPELNSIKTNKGSRLG